MKLLKYTFPCQNKKFGSALGDESALEDEEEEE